jgi:hypothetical protein
MFLGIEQRGRTRHPSRALVVGGLVLCASLVDWASVRVMQVQPSSSHPQITVLDGGKPAGGVRVRILRIGAGEPVLLREGTTGADGVVPNLELPIGRYRVVATWEKLSDGLELDVTGGDSDEQSHFTLSLTCCLPPTLEELVAAAEKSSEKLRIRKLEGSVVDPTGTLVAGAQLSVLRENQGKLEQAVQFKADCSGHFSIELPGGPYVLLASASGFKTSLTLLEITAAAESGGLLIKLQVGDMTE